MRKALVFEASRDGYSIDQLREWMTVGDLIRFLEDFDEDDMFILSHDRGYTYGSISEYCCEERFEVEGEYGPEWITEDELLEREDAEDEDSY